MRHIFLYYFRMATLRANPQDGPGSKALQTVLIVFYIVLSVINALSLYDVTRGFFHSIIDLGILFVFTLLLLRTQPQRVRQTFNAFLGVGLCIGLIHTICSYSFISGEDEKTISDLGRIFFFIIFVWIIVAYGHIVRHAIEVNLAAGASISLAYTLINAFVLLTLSQAMGI